MGTIISGPPLTKVLDGQPIPVIEIGEQLIGVQQAVQLSRVDVPGDVLLVLLLALSGRRRRADRLRRRGRPRGLRRRSDRPTHRRGDGGGEISGVVSAADEHGVVGIRGPGGLLRARDWLSGRRRRRQDRGGLARRLRQRRRRRDRRQQPLVQPLPLEVFDRQALQRHVQQRHVWGAVSVGEQPLQALVSKGRGHVVWGQHLRRLGPSAAERGRQPPGIAQAGPWRGSRPDHGDVAAGGQRRLTLIEGDRAGAIGPHLREGTRQRPDVGEALRGVRREAAVQDLGQLLAGPEQLGSQGRGRLPRQDGGGEDLILSRVDLTPEEELTRDDHEAALIARWAQGLICRLLRGEVARIAEGLPIRLPPGLQQRGGRGVGDLHEVAGAVALDQEDVAGLEVAVGPAHLVQRREGAADLGHDPRHPGRGLGHASADERLERDPLQQLGDDVGLAVHGLAGFEHGPELEVVDLGELAGVIDDGAPIPLADLPMQDLEGHGLTAHGVGGVVHDPRGPLTEGPRQGVAIREGPPLLGGAQSRSDDLPGRGGLALEAGAALHAAGQLSRVERATTWAVPHMCARLMPLWCPEAVAHLASRLWREHAL